MAVQRASGNSFSRERDMHPLPQPTSRKWNGARDSRDPMISWATRETNSSVSGLKWNQKSGNKTLRRTYAHSISCHYDTALNQVPRNEDWALKLQSEVPEIPFSNQVLEGYSFKALFAQLLFHQTGDTRRKMHPPHRSH